MRWLVVWLVALLPLAVRAAPDNLAALEQRSSMVMACMLSSGGQMASSVPAFWKALEDYCGCAYDEFMQGVSEKELEQNYAPGSEAFQKRMDATTAACGRRLLGGDAAVAADNVFARGFTLGACISEMEGSDSVRQLQQQFPGKIEFEPVCQCIFDRAFVGQPAGQLHALLQPAAAMPDNPALQRFEQASEYCLRAAVHPSATRTVVAP